MYINKLNLLDFSYSIAVEGLLTMLEPTLGVINACLPVVQPAVCTVWRATSSLASSNSQSSAQKDLDKQSRQDGKLSGSSGPSYALRTTSNGVHQPGKAASESAFSLEDNDVGEQVLQSGID